MFVRCSVRDLGEKGQGPVDNWVITLYPQYCSHGAIQEKYLHTSVFKLTATPDLVEYFLNQARSGRRPACAWFLKITSVRMYAGEYVCVYVRPRGHK